MSTQSSSFKKLQSQYGRCCMISISLILLGLCGAIVCNFSIGSAYLAFIVSMVLYAVAIVYQLLITVKAAGTAKKEDLSQDEKMSLNKFTFRLCAFVIGCAIVQISISFPLVTLPWLFTQRIIAVGWLENAWLPGAITLAVCLYLWWFLDTTAIIKGYWKRQPVNKSEKAVRTRYILWAVVLMLAVFLLQLLFNCIPIDTLAGGNTFQSWDEFVAFMELPRDEWGNVVDRWLDHKIPFFDEEETTVLCEYIPMNYSVHHTTLSENSTHLPVTVYTNLQMLDAEALQKNVKLLLYALYLAIPIFTIGFYFWNHKLNKKHATN